MVKVSVVVTVLNETHTITLLLDALRRQTLAPREVVVVDGGSADSTFQQLTSYRKKWRTLKVFRHAGNRSLGRNFGVSKTTSPIIAFTDAGCIPEPNWLEELTKPFLHDRPSIHVVSGYYHGLAKTSFQKALVPFVLVMPDRAGKTEFFPSARSMAIRRQVIKATGGFPNHLDHNEDYAYAHILKNHGYSFTFAPQAQVAWIPPASLASAAWMFFRFALGDIQAGILRPRVKLLGIRYLIGVFLFFLLWEIRPLFSLSFLLLALAFYSLWATLKNFRYVKHPTAIFWLPLLQLTADFSVLFGSLVGLLYLSATR